MHPEQEWLVYDIRINPMAYVAYVTLTSSADVTVFAGHNGEFGFAAQKRWVSAPVFCGLWTVAFHAYM